MVNLSSIPLVVLPLALIIIGVNLYFRLRIMRGFGNLHKKGVRLNPGDMMSKDAREALIKDQYPEHRDEITRLSRLLGLSIKLITSTVICMLLIFLFTYFGNK